MGGLAVARTVFADLCCPHLCRRARAACGALPARRLGHQLAREAAGTRVVVGVAGLAGVPARRPAASSPRLFVNSTRALSRCESHLRLDTPRRWA